MESNYTPSNPTILHERSFSATVSHVEICPNKRLFALVLDGVSVAIFKSNCQRLASISVCTEQEEIITSYTWSPDGASIAVASSNASLSIYSVDRCALTISKTKRSTRETDIAAFVALPVAASCLLWSTAAAISTKNTSETAHTYEDRASVLYENSLQLDSVASSGLLLVGDNEGAVTLYTHNLQLRVARVQLLPKSVPVERIFLSPDHPFVLSVGYQRLSDGASSSEVNECILRVMDLRSVSEFWPEIERISTEVVSTSLILKRFSETISRLRKEWVNGAMNVLVSTIKAPIEKRMKDFAEDTGKRNAWGALHDIYCGAFMRNALLQFLGTDLSESGAKEALRSFRAHADDVEEAIVSLLPFAEQMMFRASEYRGLARMQWRFSPVGVLLDDTTEMLEASEAFYMTLQELMQESQKMSREAEAFLAWLVIVAAKAGGMSSERRDAATFDKMSVKDKELVSDFLERMTGDLEYRPLSGDSVTDLLSNGLTIAYQRIDKVSQSVFQTPNSELHAEPLSKTRYTMTWSSQDHHTLLCLTNRDGSLLFIRYEYTAKRWNVCRTSVAFDNTHILVKDIGYIQRNEVLLVGVERDHGAGKKQLKTCFAFRHKASPTELFDGCDDAVKGEDGLRLNLASTSTRLRPQKSSSLSLGQLRVDDKVALNTVQGAKFASALISSNRVMVIGINNNTS